MEPKKQALQYRFYFLWSFITVTSVPFFLGLLIAGGIDEIFSVDHIYIMEFELKTYGILGWVFAIGFWLVLLLLIKRKSHDQDNPLYMLLGRHATIGGTLQAITSLPIMIFSLLDLGSSDGMSAAMWISLWFYIHWLYSSIVSGLIMLVYDIFIVYKMYKMYRENIDFLAVTFSRRFIFVLVTIFLSLVGIVLWYLFF